MSTSIAQRLQEIAGTSPGDVALIGFDAAATENTLTWAQLAEFSAHRCAVFTAATERWGTGAVAVNAANTVESVIDIMAVLSAGLPLLLLNAASPDHERSRLLEFVSRYHDRTYLATEGGITPRGNATRIGRTAPPNIAYLLPTGGSSGRPKIYVHPGPLRYDAREVPSALRRHAAWRTGQRQLILGPLHHAAPFMTILDALLDANTVVLPPYFLPKWAVELVERYSVEWVQLTPAHMRSVMLLAQPDPSSFRSVRTVLHTAAPCDPMTKRKWIDLVGPEHLYEMYSSTEGIGATLVRGDEWLQRPGTVGRGFFTQIRIVDEAGGLVEPGATGRVFMRAPRRGRGVNPYLGDHTLDVRADGFASVGDYGRLDEDGYLFLAPRRVDVINVGGEKVYPHEIEAELLQHPAVVDAVATGIPDDTLGSAVAAQVVLRPDASASGGELVAHCRRRLANYKVPTRIEFVATVPRSDAGKIQRWKLSGNGT